MGRVCAFAKRMSPNTPPRVKGFDYRGPRRYFVTVCTHRRLQWLANVEDARHFAEQISPFFEARGFAVLAYCLMPDHAHLLLEGVVETADFAEAMRAWKQRTGYDWKRRHGTSLWQAGFHDRVLRSEDDTPAVVRYVLVPVQHRAARRGFGIVETFVETRSLVRCRAV